MNSRIASLMVCMAGLFSAVVWAYPTPAGVQGMNEWTFRVTYSQPQQIMFRVDDSGRMQRY